MLTSWSLPFKYYYSVRFVSWIHGIFPCFPFVRAVLLQHAIYSHGNSCVIGLTLFVSRQLNVLFMESLKDLIVTEIQPPFYVRPSAKLPTVTHVRSGIVTSACSIGWNPLPRLSLGAYLDVTHWDFRISHDVGWKCMVLYSSDFRQNFLVVMI